MISKRYSVVAKDWVNLESIINDLSYRIEAYSLLNIEDLTDPGDDRIMFWDESEDVTAWLTVSTGLQISGTNMTTKDNEIVHDDLSGFVANEHVNHTGVTISVGTGLSGGGDISANRTIGLDAGLENLSQVSMAADQFYYTTADNTHAAASVTSFARTVLDDTTAAAFNTTLGLGTGDSPTHTGLTAINENSGSTVSAITTAATSARYPGFKSYLYGTEGCGIAGFYRAKGTQAAPTVVGASELSGWTSYNVHNDSAIVEIAKIECFTGSSFAANRYDSYLVFSVGDNDSVDEAFRIEHDKVTAAGLDVTGLTDSYVPYVGSGAFANSPMYTDGTSVGIGSTTFPAGELFITKSSGNARSLFWSTGASNLALHQMICDNSAIDISAWGDSAAGSYLGIARAGGSFLIAAPTNWMGIGTSNATPLRLGTNGTVGLLMDTSQQIGINGVTSPASVLDMGAGEFTCGSINRVSGDLTIKAGGTTFLTLKSGDATYAAYRLKIDHNSSPGLEIINGATQLAILYHDTSNGTFTNYVGEAYFTNQASGKGIGFVTGGSTRVYLKSTGACGFGGTLSPAEDVHAADTVRADVAFNINGTDGGTFTFLDNDGNTIAVVGGLIMTKTPP